MVHYSRWPLKYRIILLAFRNNQVNHVTNLEVQVLQKECMKFSAWIVFQKYDTVVGCMDRQCVLWNILYVMGRT